jgi:exopolyphosphatase/guanosine-5'-triphosphate,3'-diphosphate pyrophosphatase
MPQSRTIAVVDVGSNSVRLLVARELSPLAFEVVDEERYDARLGEDQVAGELTPEAIERGLTALRVINQVARSHAPTTITVVGTEALRRAPNAAAFLDLAREQTGLPIRILSGVDEALVGFLGVINSTALRDGNLLDLGGGSLELMSVQDRALTHVQSAPLGAIYARDRYLQKDPPSQRDIRALRKAVRQQITVAEKSTVLYGTGGAVRNLARLIRIRRRYPLRRIHGLVIERRELHRLANALVRATPDQRRQMPGLNSNRVDILPAAALVIDEVMEITGATTLTVAGQGLREGLVWQQLRPESPVISDVRAASISGIARANGVDELAAEPVVSVAAMLFDAMSELHGYGQPELELLLFAARLAGIGMHIDYYNRDRHAEYLVHSGDLRGFAHREIVLLAALVRWAVSGTPDLSTYPGIVQPDDTRRALVLASLLGVARAIRRRIPSPVLGLELDLHTSRLDLILNGHAPLDAELYELERQQKRFETAFKLPFVASVRNPQPLVTLP